MRQTAGVILLSGTVTTDDIIVGRQVPGWSVQLLVREGDRSARKGKIR
jgi:hypothetical protein